MLAKAVQDLGNKLLGKMTEKRVVLIMKLYGFNLINIITKTIQALFVHRNYAGTVSR